jgi:hypothetical protein
VGVCFNAGDLDPPWRHVCTKLCPTVPHSLPAMSRLLHDVTGAALP